MHVNVRGFLGLLGMVSCSSGFIYYLPSRTYQVAYLSSKIVVVARRPSYKGNNAMQLLLLFVVDYKCHHEYFIRSGLPISTY